MNNIPERKRRLKQPNLAIKKKFDDIPIDVSKKQISEITLIVSVLNVEAFYFFELVNY